MDDGDTHKLGRTEPSWSSGVDLMLHVFSELLPKITVLEPMG